MSDKTVKSETLPEEAQADAKQNAPKEKNAGFDEAAESEMMRRLRDLGYVE